MKIHLGQMESFELGNLDSMRDWGHAKDYVKGEKRGKDCNKCKNMILTVTNEKGKRLGQWQQYDNSDNGNDKCDNHHIGHQAGV